MAKARLVCPTYRVSTIRRSERRSHLLILTCCFLQAEYYARPENFHPIFHATLAPHATAIINCMYWERRFPRLLTKQQLRELAGQAGGMKLLGVADITCDVEGSIECLRRSTDIEKPFFR